MSEHGPPRTEPQRPLARLAGQGSVYMLSNMAVKGAGLVLLVVYLDPALLTVADYGRLGLMEAVAQAMAVVFGLGLGTGLLRYTAGRLPDGAVESDRAALPATVLLAAVTSAVVAVATIAAFRQPLAGFILDDPLATTPLLLMAAYTGLRVVQDVPLAFFRSREQATLYAVAIGVETMLLLGGVWYALAILRGGLTGVLQAWVFAAGVSTVSLSVGLLWNARARPRMALLRPLMRFGLPLVAASLASVALNTADRFLLKAFVDASEVALYVLAAKYGGLINMALVQSFHLAFAVIGLKALAAGDLGFHRSAFRHFAVGAGWVVLGLALFAADLTRVLSAEPAYAGVEMLVLPVAIGFWAYGLYVVPLNALFAAERTRATAGAVGGAALLNVLLNLAMIPAFGAAGAAWATFLAYAALAVGTAYTASAQVELRLPWKTAGATLALVVGLWAVGLQTADWALGPRLGARAALVLAYVPAVFALGLYGRADLARGLEWAGGLLRR